MNTAISNLEWLIKNQPLPDSSLESELGYVRYLIAWGKTTANLTPLLIDYKNRLEKRLNERNKN